MQIDRIASATHFFIAVHMEHHSYRLLAGSHIILVASCLAVRTKYMSHFHGGVQRVVMPIATGQANTNHGHDRHTRYYSFNRSRLHTL